jgi:hypothetical protein
MNRHIALAALALLSTPALAASETDQVARSDGSLIHYTLDRPIGEVSGLLLLSQGSGCRPGTRASPPFAPPSRPTPL